MGARFVAVLAVVFLSAACGLTLDAVPPFQGPSDGGVADAGMGTECSASGDCAAMGPPRCGSWVCESGYCALDCPECDDGDGDGYGVGAGCVGLDCDDADRDVGDDPVFACSSAPAAARGIGACRDGAATCTAGVAGACFGEVLAGPETCDGVDDDCDGTVDEGLGDTSCGVGACASTSKVCVGGTIAACTPGMAIPGLDTCDGIDSDCDGRVDEDCDCVYVSRFGSPDPVNPTEPTQPFRMIQDAIDYAEANPAGPQRVCVSASDCGVTIYDEAVRMADGVSVEGDFRSDFGGKCAQFVTFIRNVDGAGVRFSGLTMHTQLSRFVVLPDNSRPTSAGITIENSRHATLSEVRVQPADGSVVPDVSIGVDVRDSFDVVIRRSNISGGRGVATNIGVRAIGSRVAIVDNCPQSSGGRCTLGCSRAEFGIRGTRFERSDHAIAVKLEDSPGSVIARSALCNGTYSGVSEGLVVLGDAAGTVVTQSQIYSGVGETTARAIGVRNCPGVGPLIVDNVNILAEAQTPMMPSYGIEAVDCAVVVQDNERITGAAEGRGTGTGIACEAGACAITGNQDVLGSADNSTAVSATGVSCSDGGCARVVGNTIQGGRARNAVGLELGDTGALVGGNRITGGCAANSTTGIAVSGSRSRIENNFVTTFSCATGGALPTSVGEVTGMEVIGPALVDVHSNSVAAALTSNCSQATALAFVAGETGQYRNNALSASGCMSTLVVYESDVAADPTLFVHNALDPWAGAVPYLDEGSTAIQATDVDPSNLSVDPMFVNYPSDLHITNGSPLAGAGTGDDRPGFDFDGDARGMTPDIGADEVP